MKQDRKNARLSAAFLQSGSQQGVISWLQFRQWMHQRNWVEAVDQYVDARQPNSTDVFLRNWLQQANPQPVSGLLIGLPIVAAAAGAAAMAATLNYSGPQPINVWLFLLLFALGPLLMTVLALASQLTRQRLLAPLVSLFRQRLQAQLKISLGASSEQALLTAFAAFFLQRSGLYYLLGALFSFLLLATFQDFSFGWSSTLVQDSDLMTQAMQLLTLPWSWWHPTVSAELITASRYYHGQPLALPERAGDWWQTLLLATVVYGFIPRLLLTVWLQRQMLQALQTDMLHSGDLLRLDTHLHQQSSWQALDRTLPEQAVPRLKLNTAHQHLIGWHCQQPTLQLIRNIGLSDWAADADWLRQFQDSSRPVYLLVAITQTPTAELADCLSLLRSQQPVSGLILTEPFVDPLRRDLQLESWQLFADQHQVTLYLEEKDDV